MASDLASMTILAILEQQGIQIGEAHQLIGATLADSHLAAMLDSAVGAPLLTIEQIVMDTGKRPVERFFTWYNCDQYDHPALVFDRETLEFVHGVAAAR
jgi:GntR family transcriptional regulator